MNKITERVANMDPVLNFLHCETSNDWIKLASKNLDILLVDHANCEKNSFNSYKFII